MDLSFRLTSLSDKPDTRWTKKYSPTHGTHGPADEHGNVTPSPARSFMPDSPMSGHMFLENVTSKGRGSRDVCGTRANTHILRERYTTSHQVTGRPLGHHWGDFSARNLRECCEGPVPRSRSEKGGLDTDLYFLLIPFSTSRTRGGPWAQHTGSTSPAAPASEHENVTPSRACHAVQGIPTPQHTSLENHRHA